MRLPEVTVLATPDLLKERRLFGFAAAVIDVLRATSSISTAFSSGCQKLIPARSKEEALAKKALISDALVTGEQGGLRIPGFDLGNSPFEYAPAVVGGKTVIMTTSNGTRAILGAAEAGASPVLICSFLNAPAVARDIADTGKDVAIVCSGEHGAFSLEDYACAGALVGELASLGSYELDSASRAALCLYEAFERDALEVLAFAPHGRELIGLGFEKDLRYCADVGAIDVVPAFAGGMVTRSRI